MAYTDQIRRTTYTANGVSTTFTVPFDITDQRDLIVYINNQLAIFGAGGDYTVTFNGDFIESITTTRLLSSGTIVILQSNVIPSRVTNFTNNVVIRSSAYNVEFDRVYSLLDELRERLDRKFGGSEGAVLSASTVFPNPNPGFVIGWNSNNQLENVQAPVALNQLPNIAPGDANKFISVKLDETGYQLAALGVDVDGNVIISNAADPFIKIQDSNNNTNSSFQLSNISNTDTNVKHISTSASNLNIDAVPLDNISSSTINIFKNTITSGSRSINLYAGNNTTQIDSSFGVGGADSYITRGNVGIGTSAPRTSFDINRTDALIIPNGTTAQRPTKYNGSIRFNSTNSNYEAYISATDRWHKLDNWTILGEQNLTGFGNAIYEIASGLDAFDEIEVLGNAIGPSLQAEIAVDLYLGGALNTGAIYTNFGTGYSGPTSGAFRATADTTLAYWRFSYAGGTTFPGAVNHLKLNIHNPSKTQSGLRPYGISSFHHYLGATVAGGYHTNHSLNAGYAGDTLVSGLRFRVLAGTWNFGRVLIRGRLK